ARVGERESTVLGGGPCGRTDPVSAFLPCQHDHRCQDAAALPPVNPRAAARNGAVADPAARATTSGGPVATTFPPSSPPSGPRSITQSAHLMTSILCSITTIVLP